MKIAQALTQAQAQYPFMSEPGAEPPPEMNLLKNLASAGSGFGMGQLGGGIVQALAQKGLPALQGLGQAGAVFPEGEGAALPEIESGSKAGDPHALYAYQDNFGPDGSARDIYNVFGDPSHPAIKQVGWGSSVTKDILDKAGIPITGVQKARNILNARSFFHND